MRLTPDTPEHRQPPEEGLPMTSLIDVIFLLLIFFMLTASFATKESQLSSALRVEREHAGRSADFEPQIVHVGPGPLYRVGQREARTREELVSILRELVRERGVFVRVEDAAPVSATATALQACRDAGFPRISYVPAGGTR